MQMTINDRISYCTQVDARTHIKKQSYPTVLMTFTITHALKFRQVVWHHYQPRARCAFGKVVKLLPLSLSLSPSKVVLCTRKELGHHHDVAAFLNGAAEVVVVVFSGAINI
jgi:hypothetical protein